MTNISFYARIQDSQLQTLNAFLVNRHKTTLLGNNIHLFIDSNGGDPNVGFSIHNLLTAQTSELWTYNVSRVHSAALYMFLAAPLEQRIMNHNSSFYFHNTTLNMNGSFTEEQLRLKVQNLEFGNKSAKQLLSSKLNWTDSFIEDLWNNEVFMDADMALKHGLVSQVKDITISEPTYYISD